MDPNQPGENPFAAPIGTSAPVAATPTTSGLAIASLVLGILSFLFSILTAIPAIILGILALRSIGKSNGAVQGSGLAIAGITTGGVGTVMIVGCAALLLPAVQAAREAARTNMSMNNMKQIALSMHIYYDENGSFPPAFIADDDGTPLLSWRVALLPHLEEGALAQQFHLDEPWDSPHNLALVDKIPMVYQSPNADLPAGETNYLLVTGPGSMFQTPGAGPLFENVRDGASNTVAFVEADRSVPWTKPDEHVFDPNNPAQGLGGYRPSGFLAAFFDGHVQMISQATGAQAIASILNATDGR